jgi:RNA polymerase sigma-70 factor (ECF subfamily)
LIVGAWEQLVAEAPADPASDAPARSAPTDESLAAAAAGGDRAAFGALIDRHADRVFRFVLARLRDRHDAEEVTQEAFLRAWGAIGRYDGRWRFSTWLFTIARREAITVLRRRRDERGLARATTEEERRIEPSEEARERSLWALARAVLGHEEYEAMWLRYVEDRSTREIATIVGKNGVSVRVMLHRARERLRQALAAEEGTEGRADP